MKLNRPNALYRRFFGGRVYARQCPSRALLPLLSRAIDSRCTGGAERANPGSLGRLSRVAACARSSELHPLFCTILHWGSRRSARDKNFGRGSERPRERKVKRSRDPSLFVVARVAGGQAAWHTARGDRAHRDLSMIWGSPSSYCIPSSRISTSR